MITEAQLIAESFRFDFWLEVACISLQVDSNVTGETFGGGGWGFVNQLSTVLRFHSGVTCLLAAGCLLYIVCSLPSLLLHIASDLDGGPGD